jgi:hypothetical protein
MENLDVGLSGEGAGRSRRKHRCVQLSKKGIGDERNKQLKDLLVASAFGLWGFVSSYKSISIKHWQSDIVKVLCTTYHGTL